MGLLVDVNSSCCLKRAHDSLTIVAISYFRSCTRLAMSIVDCDLLPCVCKPSSSELVATCVSMALEEGWLWVWLRDVMACKICSTAVLIVVFNCIISVLSKRSSEICEFAVVVVGVELHAGLDVD